MNIKVCHRKAFIICLGAFLIPAVWLPAQVPTGPELLDRINEITNVTNARSVMTQTIRTSSGQLRTFEMESFSANKGEKTLMRYRKPASVKGQAFLMLNHADDIWTYFPRTKRVRKLASHAKKQSAQGSDFTYEDMGGGDTWKEEFEPTNLGEVELEGQSCWKLQLDGIPEKEPPYPRMVIIVRQEDYHPLQVDYYSDLEDVMKSLYMGDIQEVDGIPTAMKMTMRNHDKGTETKMEVLSMTYDWEPPKGFFSERNLKK